MAKGVATLAKTATKAAAVAADKLAKHLSPVDQGRLSQAIADVVRTDQRAALSVPRGLTGAQKELALDLSQMGLDVVGIIEPTPFADAANGLISLFRGDWLGAGISAVSMIPYLGDAAKAGKIGHWAKTVANAVDLAGKNPAFAKAIRPTMEKLAESLNNIPARVLDAMPASMKKNIVEARTRLNGFVAGRNVHILDGGSKGAWSKALNGRLEKNADYLVNGYLYKTDNLGRIKSVEGSVDLKVAARNGYQQAKVGKSGAAGDEGGHLIASIFNGPGEKLNLVPMNGNFNKGAWKAMENKLADAAAKGKRVEVRIEVQYGSASGRPDGFLARYSIDGGREVIKAYKNSPKGI